ncbi:MAG: lysophospholipid acyltransferase family protein, partial [Bacteroidota bacterium]
SALVSQSKDGEYLSNLLAGWGFTMIRGSSHIGGKEAMQLMTTAVSEGNGLCITPDGPRGPRHEMKMGAVRVAQKTEVPLVVIGIGVKNKKVLRSWDKFEIPMLFSTVNVLYSAPIIVPGNLSGEALENFKRNVEGQLNDLQQKAEVFT